MEWKDASPKSVLKMVEAIGGDGWSIFPVDWYTDHGIPIELIEPLEEVLKSNLAHPKSTIFKDGKPVDSMKGVYTLRVLYEIAANLSIDEEARQKAFVKLGRGTQASELSNAIIEYLRQLPEVVVVDE